MLWNNGYKFERNWKNDLKEGKGIYCWNAESWRGDRYEENIKMVKQKEKEYIGIMVIYLKVIWKKNQKVGKGKFNYNDGDIYEGDFKKGTFEGKGKYFWNEGDFKKDVIEGKERNDIL